MTPNFILEIKQDNIEIKFYAEFNMKRAFKVGTSDLNRNSYLITALVFILNQLVFLFSVRGKE